jgi:hypothetical protein
MNIVHILFFITCMHTYPAYSSQNHVSYALCKTGNQQTDTYRAQLKIGLSDETWSPSLQENMDHYQHHKKTLLDEKTGRYLIAIAEAIKPGEDIIKDQPTIQHRLIRNGLGRSHWWITCHIVDASSRIERTTTLEIPNDPIILSCQCVVHHMNKTKEGHV